MNDVHGSERQGVGEILWQGKFIILVSVVVMVVLAFVYTASEAKVYQATALLQVNIATNQPGSVDTTNTNQGLAQNYATLLISPGLLDTIRTKIEGGRLSTADLQGRLTATALPGTALVQLNANGPSPAVARQLAQQVVAGFLTQLRTAAGQRTSQLQAQDQLAIASLTAQIAKLKASPSSPANSQQVTSLNSSLQALISQNEALVASGLAQGTSATQSAPAVAATDPISPRRSINVIGGFVLGLVLGVALAWIRHLLRPELRSAEDATSSTGLSVLASIPLKPKLKGSDPAVIESYRVLSTNLSFMMRKDDEKVIAVTGFGPRVGKTSVVMGLADAMAERGRTVLVVDGDMRAASLSANYGHPNSPGLVDVLQGAIGIEPVLIDLGRERWLLPARPSRSNAASLLSGERTAKVIDDLRERFDVIIFDSPPIAALADGLILASLADRVMIVARTGLTKPSHLTAVTTSLTQGSAKIAGLVVFEPASGDLYYPLHGSAEVLSTRARVG